MEGRHDHENELYFSDPHAERHRPCINDTFVIAGAEHDACAAPQLRASMQSVSHHRLMEFREKRYVVQSLAYLIRIDG